MTVLDYGWQLDAEIWKLIPSDVSNSANWRSVDVELVSAPSVPDSAGIYCFCVTPVGKRRKYDLERDLFSQLYTPIYIGKSSSLRRRFVEHCTRPASRLAAAKACYGYSMDFWFLVREPDVIAEEEALLIKCFGPTVNAKPEAIRGTLGAPRDIGIRS